MLRSTNTHTHIHTHVNTHTHTHVSFNKVMLLLCRTQMRIADLCEFVFSISSPFIAKKECFHAVHLFSSETKVGNCTGKSKASYVVLLFVCFLDCPGFLLLYFCLFVSLIAQASYCTFVYFLDCLGFLLLYFCLFPWLPRLPIVVILFVCFLDCLGFLLLYFCMFVFLDCPGFLLLYFCMFVFLDCLGFLLLYFCLFSLIA